MLPDVPLPPPDPNPDLDAARAPPARPPSPGFLWRNRVRLFWGGVVFLACGVARFLWWFFFSERALRDRQ